MLFGGTVAHVSVDGDHVAGGPAQEAIAGNSPGLAVQVPQGDIGAGRGGLDTGPPRQKVPRKTSCQMGSMRVGSWPKLAMGNTLTSVILISSQSSFLSTICANPPVVRVLAIAFTTSLFGANTSGG